MSWAGNSTLKGLAFLGFGAAALTASAAPAAAQLFCPGGTITGGVCTVVGVGGVGSGFAVAALSSEGLNDIVQASTSVSLEAVRERRVQEADQCPEGFERVRGECQRATRPQTAQQSTSKPISVKRVRVSEPAKPPAMVLKAPPVPYASYEPTVAVWAQGFGDYERHTNLSPGAFETLASGASSPVNLARTTTTGGGLGGVDVTWRNVIADGDGLMLGALAGYQHSHISFDGAVTSSTTANMEGPSVGGYLTYFSKTGFSLDLLFRADLFKLDESFNQTFFLFAGGVLGGSVTASGALSTRMTNYTTAGNVNYKIYLPTPWFGWIEPTAGFRYTRTDFDAAAAAFGMVDGFDLRVQGGARFGTDYTWGSVRVTPTLTGLAYSDVSVGGTVLPISGLPVGAVPSDAGKIRGEGILALNFDYGNGFSSFVLGEVRGGQDLFGAGGKGGVRYQW